MNLRKLEEGATFCGWCDAYERAAKHTEARNRELEARVTKTIRFIEACTEIHDPQRHPATHDLLHHIRQLVLGELST